jgi:hypothetical protein
MPRLAVLARAEGRACDLADVRRELGREGWGDHRMVTHVRALVRDHGFPAPLPAPTRGGRLTSEVTRGSTWLRAAVDTWLDGFLPPEAAAGLDAAACAEAAVDMDASAAALCSGLRAGRRGLGVFGGTVSQRAGALQIYEPAQWKGEE